ncbi:unnamed protein product [Spirodela intermedia]|nr:unnamed protein product [Spirodela intermedia]
MADTTGRIPLWLIG